MNTELCCPVCPGPAVAAGDGGPISTSSPAAIPTRQAQLLRAIRTLWPSGAFNNDTATIESLRRDLGWETRGRVTRVLRALREHGLLRSEGRSKVNPERWVWKVEEAVA